MWSKLVNMIIKWKKNGQKQYPGKPGNCVHVDYERPRKKLWLKHHVIRARAQNFPFKKCS